MARVPLKGFPVPPCPAFHCQEAVAEYFLLLLLAEFEWHMFLVTGLSGWTGDVQRSSRAGKGLTGWTKH